MLTTAFEEVLAFEEFEPGSQAGSWVKVADCDFFARCDLFQRADPELPALEEEMSVGMARVVDDGGDEVESISDGL